MWTVRLRKQKSVILQTVTRAPGLISFINSVKGHSSLPYIVTTSLDISIVTFLNICFRKWRKLMIPEKWKQRWFSVPWKRRNRRTWVFYSKCQRDVFYLWPTLWEATYLERQIFKERILVMILSHQQSDGLIACYIVFRAQLMKVHMLIDRNYSIVSVTD